MSREHLMDVAALRADFEKSWSEADRAKGAEEIRSSHREEIAIFVADQCKNVVSCCLAGEEERLKFGSGWEAWGELQRVREQLEAIGVEVTQRWRARS